MTRPHVVATPALAWRDGRPARLGRVERSLERAIAVAYGATYDRVVEGFAPYEALVDEIAEILARSEKGRALRVLDVACGTGSVARRLARHGHTVTGLDAIAVLVERARRCGGARVRFERADVAEGTRFADDSFDACVSVHTLNWHPRPAAILIECRRLLRPGGQLVILSYTRPATVRATFAAVRAREGVRAAVSALRWLLPTALFEACRHYTARYPDVRTLHGAVTDAGFEICESRPAFLAGVSRLVWARFSGQRTLLQQPSAEER